MKIESYMCYREITESYMCYQKSDNRMLMNVNCGYSVKNN